MRQTQIRFYLRWKVVIGCEDSDRQLEVVAKELLECSCSKLVTVERICMMGFNEVPLWIVKLIAMVGNKRLTCLNDFLRRAKQFDGKWMQDLNVKNNHWLLLKNNQ